MKPSTDPPAAQPPVGTALAHIPEAMRAAKRWLLHRSGSKQPFYANGRPRSGKLDSERDTAQLATFDEACTVIDISEGLYAGLGFALGDGWHGGDLDGCRDPATGLLTPQAQAIVEQCNTYVEISQSGKGLHVLTYDPKGEQATLGANGSGFEFYSSKRYFIVTGNRVKAAPKKWMRSATIIQLFRTPWGAAKDVPPGKPVPANPPTGGSIAWPGEALMLKRDLRHVPCPEGGYTRWRDVGMGIHDASGGSEEGFAIWHAWSQLKTVAGYKNEADCRYYWASFKATPGGITIRSVQALINEFRPQQPAPPPPSAHRLPTSFMVDDLDTMDIPATEWLVEGIIAPGLTLLTAPPKQGKSYLSLQMGLCVAAGLPFLNRPTRACRVTYFDLEEWHGLLRERLTPIRQGNRIPKGVPLAIELETGVGVEAVEHMAREIARGSKLVIVDLLARIRDEMGEDARKNVYARDMKFIGMLAGFSLAHPGVAIVVVHHANKGNHDDWQNKISGSAGMAGASHCNLYMARPKLTGMSEDDKREAMRYRVLHANGKQVKEQEIVLEMMDADGGWQVSGLKPWEISTTRKQKRILELLHARYPEHVTSKEVADLLGLKALNVRQMMYQMRVQGTIESDGRGGDGYRAKVSGH